MLERRGANATARQTFGSTSNLLKALALISEMYRAGKRTLPLKPPTAFIRRAWRPFVFKDGDIDRRAYELCVFSELRNRLRAGDVWVDRSRHYQDFETYLIPKLTFEILKAEGPLPVEIETEVQSYLESRRSALTQELTTVATLAESGELHDVDLAEGDLKITPLRAVTPPEAVSLRDAAYDLLPRIKITDLLLEVDRWTGFSECFTHQRNGQPAENKAALLTTILADGINLGLSRMAEACRGATLRQLAWAGIDTSPLAFAIITSAYRRQNECRYIPGYGSSLCRHCGRSRNSRKRRRETPTPTR